MNEQELAELLHPIKDWYVWVLHPRMTQRDEAIMQWLSEHKVADYVVLDDVPRFFSGYPSKWSQLIVCNAAWGIADIQVQQRLQAWLNGQARV